MGVVAGAVLSGTGLAAVLDGAGAASGAGVVEAGGAVEGVADVGAGGSAEFESPLSDGWVAAVGLLLDAVNQPKP